MSSEPLTGKFIITCVNTDNTGADTYEIAYDSNYNTIKEAIYDACPSYRDKIEVWMGPKYDYIANGKDFYIKFFGVEGDVPAFSLKSGTITTLNGNEITFSSEEAQTASTNIFYEPIPFDLLHTQHSEP